MRCGSLDAGNGARQVVERAAAARATDILRLGSAQAGSLQYGKGCGILHLERQRALTLRLLVEQHDAVGQPVKHQCAHVGSSVELEILLVALAHAVLLKEHHRGAQFLTPQFVHQCALLAQAVLVVALCYDNHPGHGAQQRLHLVVKVEVSEEQELDACPARRHGHEVAFRKHGISALLALPQVSVHQIASASHALVLAGQAAPHINVVGRGLAVGSRVRLVVEACGYDHRHIVATNVANRSGAAARRIFVVELRGLLSRNFGVSGASHHIFGQFVSHRHLHLGSLAQAYAQRVANAVGQQCANAHGTLYASVLALAGLCHAKVQRKVHVLHAHHAAQQAHRAHHHLRVRCLDRHSHVLEPLLHTHTQKLHAALHNARRCVAVAAHDAVGERAVVHANAQSRVVLLTDVEQFGKPLFKSCQFGGILLVGVFQVFELSCRVHIVTRIDAHLLHNGSRHIGHIGVEVHVGHQRAVVAALQQFVLDVAQVLGLACALCGQSHIVGPSVEYGHTLLHATLGVGGGSGGHALYAQRIVAAEWPVANHHLVAHSRIIVEYRHLCSKLSLF